MQQRTGKDEGHPEGQMQHAHKQPQTRISTQGRPQQVDLHDKHGGKQNGKGKALRKAGVQVGGAEVACKGADQRLEGGR